MALVSVKETFDKYGMNVSGVIHIGAHYGGENGEEIEEYLSIGAKRIVLFEPLKENFQILTRNASKFQGNIELHNVALGNANDFVTMNVSSNECQSSSILKPKIHLEDHPEVSFTGEETVELKKLDDYNISNCNMMVIDVQGYELEVFKGSTDTLKNIDYIYCEVNRAQVYDGNVEIDELDEYLEEFSFKRVETQWWPTQKWGDALYIKVKHKLYNFPSIYYVSLKECEDRRDNLIKQFENYGVDRITGIISERFKDSNDIVLGKYVHTLNDGTKGCAVSHIKAIFHWYHSCKDEIGFFCEDDLSLETVNYWNFVWDDFVKTLPEDAECVQLLTIRDDFDTFELRERYWNDWGATAYILKRDYAKKILDNYITSKGEFNLEIPNSDIQPLIENILFTNIGKVYTIPLFVEENKFESTFTPEEDSDVNSGQKNNHYIASQKVLEYWKGKTMKRTLLEELLIQYGLDTENPEINFQVGLEYEKLGHNAPALSFFLRAAERTDNDTLAYEALIHGSNCYDRQGTRDTTAKGLLQQALCILPERPEAYFLISRFSEKRNWWQDCYIFADQALRTCNFDCEPLSTDVEYVGRYSLIFQKAMSGWWWEKVDESRELFLDLLNNHEMNDMFKELTIQNLEMMGYKPEIRTTPTITIPLKKGVESLSKLIANLDCSLEELNIDNGGYEEINNYIENLKTTSA